MTYFVSFENLTTPLFIDTYILQQYSNSLLYKLYSNQHKLLIDTYNNSIIILIDFEILKIVIKLLIHNFIINTFISDFILYQEHIYTAFDYLCLEFPRIHNNPFIKLHFPFTIPRNSLTDFSFNFNYSKLLHFKREYIETKTNTYILNKNITLIDYINKTILCHKCDFCSVVKWHIHRNSISLDDIHIIHSYQCDKLSCICYYNILNCFNTSFLYLVDERYKFNLIM